MIITVKNEAPFQVLTGAFTIGPSPTGYELQVGATPQSFTTLFSVGANTPRMVTNVANGSYYRLKNNVGDVKVNWSRTCIDNQGGGGSGSGSTYTAGEYIQIENDVISVTGITPSEYLTTADTQDFATEAYVDAAITSATQDFATEAYVDSAITSATQDLASEAYVDQAITAATSPIQEQVDDIERVTATALTELHDSILELSGATGDFATEDYVDQAITAVTQGTYTTGNTFTKTGKYNQKSFYYLDPLGYDAPEFYAPTTSGIPGQVLIAASGTSKDGTSNTPVWTNLATINGSGLTNGGNIVIGVPQDFQDELSMKEEVIASAITQLHDEIVVISGNTPDLTNYYTKSEVDSEITAATQNMVESTSVSTIWKGTQAQYDAISVKDPHTFYIITNS